MSKTQPLNEFHRLLSWMGADVTEADILKAVNNSTFDAVKSSDTKGVYLTAGKLDDYKTQLLPKDTVAIDKHCVALYENEKTPDDAKSIVSSASMLQDRYGRFSSSEYESILFRGSLYDLKTALRSSRQKTYSDMVLAEAILKTETFMTTAVFARHMNLMDPNVKIVLASILFVFSQSDYPELIISRSVVQRLDQKRKKYARLLYQKVREIF